MINEEEKIEQDVNSSDMLIYPQMIMPQPVN